MRNAPLSNSFVDDTGRATSLVVKWLSEGGSTKPLADEALKISRALVRGGHEASEAEATAHAFFLISREASRGMHGTLAGQVEANGSKRSNTASDAAVENKTRAQMSS